MIPEDYEKYYQKGGTYVIPVEVFNEIFNEMKNWKQENQELREELEDMTLCRDIASGHRKEVQDRETILLKENQELKNTVMSLQKELNEENLQCSKYAIEIQDLKEEKQEWINLLNMFKNQQKEFIEYLENEITRKNHRWEQLANQKNRNEDALLRLDVKIEEDEIILSKYKEIIGVSDENNT